MLEWITDPNIWASLIALTAMEVVLGIDNVLFISLVASRLKPEVRNSARQIGLMLALVFRVMALMTITWIISMRSELFSIGSHSVSWRDIILFAGGLFLIVKATQEIHSGVEGNGNQPRPVGSFFGAIVQIAVIDLVFSIDSIITAVGMAEHIEVMVAAVAISILVMYFSSVAISSFIEKHPTTKMLALSFLMLVGVALVADASGFHIPRGYIYFAMAFSTAVEVLNIMSKNR
jgi:predicted tellurium resistance membrane protein TerC